MRALCSTAAASLALLGTALFLSRTHPANAAEASAPRIQLRSALNGQVQLRLIGQAGARYRVEASSDCRHWGPLTTVTLAQAELDLLDAAEPGVACRFYRAVVLDVATQSTPSAPAVLPIEVLGPDGTIRSVDFTVPAEAPLESGTRLWLQIHNLSYDHKASVQVNDSRWIALHNSNLSLSVAEPARQYGGIGGAFATLKLTVVLPANTIVPGKNTIRFRFNFSDGRSMGYRVLGLDLLSGAGKPLLDQAQFRRDDPADWRPLRAAPADLAKGEALWRQATLRAPLAAGGSVLRARCADCHAQDGRDLKYFNYSDHAIIERSKFHGLSQADGELIASYVRSLRAPNPGRPWNPPYQPGPGLDSKLIAEWSAGAGLEWVLDRDHETLAYIFPDGIQPESIRPDANLSAREVPVAMQLPDWNHWLPSVHPKDAWGAEIDNHNLLKMYNGEGRGSSLWNLRELLARSYAEGHVNFRGFKDHWAFWQLERFNLLHQKRLPDNHPGWTIEYSRKVYATALWQLVKMWELMQEFELEGQGPNFYGAFGEPRTWFDGIPFMVSPNMLHLPREGHGINNGTLMMFDYFSAAWYQVQLILNNSNRQRYGSGPIDWPYVYGFFKDLYRDSAVPNAAQMTLWLVKGMQISENGIGPEAYRTSGWSPHQVADITRYAHPDFQALWGGIRAETKAAVIEAVLENWFRKTAQYSPAQYYADLVEPIASPLQIPSANMDGTFADRVWFMVPRLRQMNVDSPLLNQIVDWAKGVWPLGNWDALKAY